MLSEPLIGHGMWGVQEFAGQSDMHQFQGEVPSLVWPSGSSSSIFPGPRLHLGAGVSEESPGGVLDAGVPSPTPLRKSPTEVEAGPPQSRSHHLSLLINWKPELSRFSPH